MAGEKVPFGRVANLVGCTIYFNADDEKYKATVLSVNPLTNRLVMKDGKLLFFPVSKLMSQKIKVSYDRLDYFSLFNIRRRQQKSFTGDNNF